VFLLHNNSASSHFFIFVSTERGSVSAAGSKAKSKGYGLRCSNCPQDKEFWGSKAFTSSRWHPPDRAGDPGPSQLTGTAAPSQPGADLDSLYDGYFRGLLPNGNPTLNTGNLENVHVWRFVEGRSNMSMAGRHLRLGGEYSTYEESFAPHLDSITTGLEGLGGRGEYPAYESVSRSTSRSSSSSDTRDALEPSVATNDEGGPRTRPVPTMFSGGSWRRAEASLSQDEPGPSVFYSRQAGGEDGDLVVTGGPFGRGGDTHGDGTPQDGLLPQGGQMLGGLKHRLLSFILQDIQDDDTIPAIVRCWYTFYFVRVTCGGCVNMASFAWLLWSIVCLQVEDTICKHFNQDGGLFSL